MATENRTRFRPVRGEEASILSGDPVQGFVYFATDTGKIYLGGEDEFITMGGSGASLFYASEETVRQDLLTEHYFLRQESLDDSKATVKVNDLIINIDGCFYRVYDFDETEIECTRMAVSGSGTGSSPGGDVPGGSTATVTLKAVTNPIPNAFIHGQQFKVKYHVTANEDSYVSIMVRVAGINDQIKEELIGLYPNDSDFEFDLGSLLFQGNNTVYIVGTGVDTDTTTTVKLSQRNAYAVSLSKVDNFNPKQVYTKDFSVICMATGSLQKTITVTIDNGALPNVTKVMSPNDSPQVSIPISTTNFAHGVHTLSITLSVTVGNITVETDPIKYEIAFNRDGAEGEPIIWFPNEYPSEITNYEDLNIEYMVYDPASTTDTNIETHFYKNTEELQSSPLYLSYSLTKVQNWYISDYEVGINHYSISCGATSRPVTVTVKEDTSRNMDIIKDALMLNYECGSRSNQENSVSRQTWESTGTALKNPIVFKNFNWYNNGWKTDNDNRTCLRISNGASISIPISDEMNLLSSAQLSNPVAFEFRFKLRNVQKYATLITTTSSIDSSGNLVVEKKVSSTEGVVGRFYNALGLCLGTQEAFFKSSKETVSVRYREDEIINLSIVIEPATKSKPLMYIYLNGILSGISSYTPGSDNFASGANEITFNSDYADIDLYKVRVYNGNYELTSADVVHNYLADIKDPVKFDANVSIISYNGTTPYVDFEKMLKYNEDHPDQTIMPYAVVEVHEPEDGQFLLPYVKGGKKAVSVEFVNPALEYAYENGLVDDATYMKSAPSYYFCSNAKSIDVQGTSSQGYPIRNFKIKMKQDDAKKGTDGCTWEYTGGPAKGKNILKKTTIGDVTYSKWYMDSDIGESTFTWKADYMESSGTHNTGFASYVNKLYERNDGTIHHPLDDYGVSHGNSIRTTVYGFPMLVFQKIVNGQNVTYKFIGKYNYNLDKGCNDTYGFKTGTSKVKDAEGKFLPMEEVAECWELTNNQGNRCSFIKVDFEETTTSYSAVETSKINENDFNAGKYYVKKMVYDESVTANVEVYVAALGDGEFKPEGPYYTKQEAALDVLNDFEYRYSYYKDQIDCAIEGKDYKDDDGNVAIPFASQTQAERNQYLLEKYKNLKDLASWLKSTEGDIDKFRSEFDQHFNREYCIIYYIATELLHLYDSRGKNMMLATWGPQTEGGNYIWYPIFYDIDTQLGINNSGVPTWDYDVEPSKNNQFSTSNSVLWVNLWEAFSAEIMDKYKSLRKGNLTFEALEGYYNSRPVLGTTVDSWKDIIKNSQEKSIVSYAKIGKRPENVINIDEYFKYIGPTMDGFINTSGKLVYDTGSFFYCLQGTRELTRYLYLRNRLNYVDSMWHGGSYASGQSGQAVVQEFWSRFDANYPQATSDRYLQYKDGDTHKTASFDKEGNPKEAGSLIADGDTEEFDVTITDSEGKAVTTKDRFTFYKDTQPLDATGDFEGVKSYLKQYMSLVYDTTQLDTTYCDGENPITLKVTPQQRESVKYTAGLTQQLMYIGGGEYISELGDLGLKYLDELHIPTLKRLKSLKVGSDVEGYYNSQLNSSNFVLAAGAYSGSDKKPNAYAKSLLETVILTGLTSLNGQIDITGSEKLKEFRALNTIISGVDLADGVQIETLHLPSTITSLSLIEPVALTQIATSPKDEDGNINKGLYVEGLTGKVRDDTPVDKTHVDSYSVVGGSLGYGSYVILEKLVRLKSAMHVMSNDALAGYKKTLGINLENVNWSPYFRVDFGDPFDNAKADLYYKDNGHNKLVKYNYDLETWTVDTSNGVIYLLDESKHTNHIANLEILKKIIDNYKEAEIYGKSKNYFTNTSLTASGITLPEITGMMYVENEEAIAEDVIYNDYIKYFPKLKIFAKNVSECYSATYVSLNNDVETIEFIERIPLSQENPHLTYPVNIQPIKINYDFRGWSLTKPTEGMSTSDLEALVLSQEAIESLDLRTNQQNKFYAIFTITTYKNSFRNPDDSMITETYTTAGTYIESPDILPSSPDQASLDLYEAYKWLGWTLSKDNCYVKNVDEFNKIKVTLESIMAQNSDRVFYAVYMKVNVHDAPTDLSFFNFTRDSYIDNADSSYNISGYVVSPKSSNINGKITLPLTYQGEGDSSPLPVINVDGFMGSGVTHVFWNSPDGDNPNLRSIHSNAFQSTGIEFFEFTSKLRFIGQSAFYARSMITDERCINLLGESPILYIGTDAFNSAFGFTNIALFKLRGTIQTIEAHAFLFQTGVNGAVGVLQIGSQEEPSVLQVCGLLNILEDGNKSTKAGIRPANKEYTAYFTTCQVYKKTGVFNDEIIDQTAPLIYSVGSWSVQSI